MEKLWHAFLASDLPLILLFVGSVYLTAWLLFGLHTWWSIGTGALTGLFGFVCFYTLGDPS